MSLSLIIAAITPYSGFGLWLYYFARFVTRQRRGRGEAEARVRGDALDRELPGLERELHDQQGATPPR